MSNIAFIPVRGGSKSVPLKNIKYICGKPLVYYSINACENAKVIDKIIVATDNIDIKNTVLSFSEFSKVSIYNRDPLNAKDNSTTESVMLEYINKSNLNDDDYFFLIQATSPMITSLDIENMFKKLIDGKYDSLLSCVVSKRFIWTREGKPINYDYTKRPRRQDFEGYMLENGACYINSVFNIKKFKNRLTGKICVYEMPEYTYIELDEEYDFIILEKLMERYVKK